MSNLTILNTAIRQHENLFSLNDLHQVSGNSKNHQPSNFSRLETTQALVSAIQAEGTANPIKTLRGTQGGTYACKEIVIAYAAWISPQFHLVVLRAFLNQLENLQKNSEIQPLAPPPKKYTFDFTEDELQSLVWAWFAFVRGIHTFRYIYPMFQKLGSNMAGTIYGQGFEYSHTAQSAHKILERITKDFDCDPMTNWRVLKHLRGFDPSFKKPTF
ncbi:P22AR C-terminal domain-containing protein [Mannheimia haemolytica]|uniref:P22AR C-terminal domain n=1 Tax=Mannheimia haemolytica TaxID=75985 RepID=A0A378NFX0_MANHA|nr:P22AR C-terminal domain-containing protein [Mannheimia haemolytica]EEY09488.1 putative bacteriophage antirepressor [Mannheimia haemolytica serotype A2 str. OVINE]EEY11777.1 putative bacteriophage antirepressor [Mannheimia haemolytica serotype A2 str. BOVINE]MDW0724247.1 P22AR C-terminal domain-containing protein [Mannheimia haemolytica]MDW0737424.1 P22AR C-terminal domain-containing protein [Mannheimia haemolytica]TCS83866.1 KilA domain-containing protein [Mannheimia haemolytica]